MGNIQYDTYPELTNEDGFENTNYDYELKIFTVPESWAVDWIFKECGDHIDIDNFNSLYTWDDTLQMYCSALEEGVLVEEHVEKRFW